ncbi:protein phosphatase CheZ [Candidatus Magnetobacterium casense]|uniref:Protein phosphatase CheZ n=1 Tax=Candidatus Magnetobacterium casense TaxID=1455061 RepID=A0ABS6RYB6_9BACT|nr:protein phosphatase CheZ [Candidatus Magnetobacterium casensis]MBV6341637.1 protein phosphatase CheZ [Candidatus Magnetobacterium casensis]
MAQYIGFNLGREEYVIPILVVQEIMKPTQTTKLPHTPQHVLGIINLRGKTISVIDLKRKLGLDSDDSDTKGNVIVTNIGRVTFGVKVDSITGVMNIEDDAIKRDIELVCKGHSDECLRGVANIGDNRMVLIIELANMLNKEDLVMIAAADTPGDDTGEVDYTCGVDDSNIGEVESKETTEPISDNGTVTQKGGERFVQDVKEAFEKSIVDRGGEKGLVDKIMVEVQGLIEAFADGDTEKAERAIMAISSYGERDLFSEVGKMTRRLHDSFKDFKLMIDPRLHDIAHDDMPEMTDKLEWVITRTDEAAGKTIEIAEKNQSKLSVLMDKLDSVEGKLNALDCTHADETLSLSFIKTELAEISNDFFEIMLAQEFQDLTGQILKKVIRLVKELEEQLLQLVVYFGVKADATKAEEKKTEEVHGPQIKAGEGIMSDQGDVDALLAEFGF